MRPVPARGERLSPGERGELSRDRLRLGNGSPLSGEGEIGLIVVLSIWWSTCCFFGGIRAAQLLCVADLEAPGPGQVQPSISGLSMPCS